MSPAERGWTCSRGSKVRSSGSPPGSETPFWRGGFSVRRHLKQWMPILSAATLGVEPWIFGNSYFVQAGVITRLRHATCICARHRRRRELVSMECADTTPHEPRCHGSIGSAISHKHSHASKGAFQTSLRHEGLHPQNA